MADLIFTRHALARMADRGIDAATVQAIVERPDMTWADRAGNLCVVGDSPEGRSIRVVLARQDNRRVITVMERN